MEDIILEFGGIAYYLDFDGLENILKPDADLESGEIEESETKTTYIQGGIEKTEVIIKKYHKGKEIDISKYETYRTLIEILLSYNEESDDTLGPERGLNSTPLPFKIAFNTLVKYKVLKEL
jgi:hypothetical protein